MNESPAAKRLRSWANGAHKDTDVAADIRALLTEQTRARQRAQTVAGNATEHPAARDAAAYVLGEASAR